MSDDRWGNDTATLLRRTTELANGYLSGLPDRPVAPWASPEAMLAALAFDLPARGEPAQQVLESIARDGDPGVMASAGPRFFGFVIGGSLPAALAADWLTSAWDQNVGLYVLGPSYAVMEETAVRWLLDLLGLPPTASVGLTTGCQMAHFVALASARRAVLLREGWDVEAQGLNGAPEVHVVGGSEAHVTISIALQMLGLGTDRMKRAAVDDQGRMRPDALREVLATCNGPTIICAQSGNVNTGAFDPMEEIAHIVAERPNAWLHVDGAFGLWAAASAQLRHLVRGVERADSWASDSHKWLNVPYDSGFVAVSDPDVHRASMMMNAAYLMQHEGDQRDPSDWVPEFSRRGRGLAVYAALRSLGRDGVTDLIERCCRLARRMAERSAAAPGVEVLNEVVLNQVLLRFGDDDALTREVVRRVQDDGTCWLSGSVWQGRAVMRISVSNWSTTDADADLSTDAILRCWDAARASAHARAAAHG